MNTYDRVFRVVGINEVRGSRLGVPPITELVLENVDGVERPRITISVAWPVREIHLGMEVQITGVPKL